MINYHPNRVFPSNVATNSTTFQHLAKEFYIRSPINQIQSRGHHKEKKSIQSATIKLNRFCACFTSIKWSWFSFWYSHAILSFSSHQYHHHQPAHNSSALHHPANIPWRDIWGSISFLSVADRPSPNRVALAFFADHSVVSLSLFTFIIIISALWSFASCAVWSDRKRNSLWTTPIIVRKKIHSFNDVNHNKRSSFPRWKDRGVKESDSGDSFFFAYYRNSSDLPNFCVLILK